MRESKKEYENESDKKRSGERKSKKQSEKVSEKVKEKWKGACSLLSVCYFCEQRSYLDENQKINVKKDFY